MSKSNEKPKNLIDKGFDLDKNLNKLAIVAGVGAAAVGAVIAAPAVVTFGAVVAGGSVAGLAVTERLQRGYEKHRSAKR